MSLDPITAGIDLIAKIVGTVWPDKTEAEKEQFELALTALKAQAAELQAQADTNTAEAASPSVFVSGWRPFVGWICGVSFAWQFVALPILLFIGNATGHVIAVPAFDSGTMMTLLMGMLGLVGARSYEKVAGVARK